MNMEILKGLLDSGCSVSLYERKHLENGPNSSMWKIPAEGAYVAFVFWPRDQLDHYTSRTSISASDDPSLAFFAAAMIYLDELERRYKDALAHLAALEQTIAALKLLPDPQPREP